MRPDYSKSQTQPPVGKFSETLFCLACEGRFTFADLGAINTDTAKTDPARTDTDRTGAADRTWIDCPHCGAHNEVRTQMQSGLGAQPHAEIVGLIDEGDERLS